MEWTPERVEQARALALTGLSYIKIAARMGVTKNAICGVSKRYGFPGRASVIGRAWTEYEDGVVRDGVELGLTDGEIAGKLGTRDRNSVTGHRRHLGLGKDAAAIQRGAALRGALARRAGKPKRQRSATEQQWAWNGPAPVEPKPMRPLRVIPVSDPVPIENNAGGCTWPVTDQRPWLVCGAALAGQRGLCRGYCAAHAQLATRPPVASLEAAA
jgi:hypothetical protein